MFDRLFGDGGKGLQPVALQAGISRGVDLVGSEAQCLLGSFIHVAPYQERRNIGAHFPTQLLRLAQELPTVGHGLSFIQFNPDENRHRYPSLREENEEERERNVPLASHLR